MSKTRVIFILQQYGNVRCRPLAHNHLENMVKCPIFWPSSFNILKGILRLNFKDVRLSEPNHIGTNLCVRNRQSLHTDQISKDLEFGLNVISGLFRVLFIQISGLFKVRFIQISGLLKVRFIQISGLFKVRFIQISGLFKVRFIQISDLFKVRFIHISGLFKVRFIQISGLFKVRFKQVPLYMFYVSTSFQFSSLQLVMI